MFVFQQNILQSKLFKNVTVHFIFLLCTVLDVKDGEFSPLSTLCLFYVLCKRHLRNIYVEGYDSNQSIGFFLLRKTEVAVSQPLTLTNAVNSWLRGFLLAFFFFFGRWKKEDMFASDLPTWCEGMLQNQPCSFQRELIYLCSTVVLHGGN